MGGYSSSTEILIEGNSAWTFAGSVQLNKWFSVVSINNEIISTGDNLLDYLSPTLIANLLQEDIIMVLHKLRKEQ